MTKREIAKKIQEIGRKLFNNNPDRRLADEVFREMCHLASTLEEEAGQEEWDRPMAESLPASHESSRG